ncbi:MAG: hypothetical protein JNK21_15190 [Rhodospirillaceae bacterium]|nr:hypothetical protein [Rhodospirillaceae bacterium]
MPRQNADTLSSVRTQSGGPDGPKSQVEKLPNGQQVRIYWRDESRCYWAEIREAGKKDRWSTKQSRYGSALLSAASAIPERKKSRTPEVTSDSFEAIARKFIELIRTNPSHLSRRSAGPNGVKRTKQTANDYILALEKWFIPFFKSTPIIQIGARMIREFESWKLSEFKNIYGREPSRSVLSNHAAAGALVWRQAEEDELIPWGTSAKFNKDGKPTRRGQPFSIFEVDELLHRIRRLDALYTSQGLHQHDPSREILFHLNNLIALTAATGMRPGSEARSVRWSSFFLSKADNGERILFVKIAKGKRGSRRAAVDGSFLWRCADPRKRFLFRLYPEQLRLPTPGEALYEAPIFERSNGKITRQDVLDKVFAKIINPIPYSLGRIASDPEKLDLRFNADADNEEELATPRTLYSLRHTYACEQINKDESTDIDHLAKQMGTSREMIEFHYAKVYDLKRGHKLASSPDGNEEEMF